MKNCRIKGLIRYGDRCVTVCRNAARGITEAARPVATGSRRPAPVAAAPQAKTLL
jgi:hypothetical protein